MLVDVGGKLYFDSLLQPEGGDTTRQREVYGEPEDDVLEVRIH
jgi:hypothetical protein